LRAAAVRSIVAVMSFRFRRSISLGRGLRINLGKRGASLSIGRRGAAVNLNAHGTRTTIGVPGTGMSWSSSRTGAGDQVGQATAPGTGRALSVGQVLLILAAAVVGAAMLGAAFQH
jgi:hypothetical protein